MKSRPSYSNNLTSLGDAMRRLLLCPVLTSGENNSCFVNALAINLLVLFHATARGYDCERQFIRSVDYCRLERVHETLNGKGSKLFDERLPLGLQDHIIKVGQALRQYGFTLMMRDVLKSDVKDRQYSETLLQTLLVAFEGHCNKVRDDFCDEVFAGMKFVTSKFEKLDNGGLLSMDLKKQALTKWWNKAYVKEPGDEAQPGGYQLYVEEVSKEGVQLSPQIGNIIISNLGLNLVFYNEGYAGLNYAGDKIDAPCIIIYRDSSNCHWEAYLDPTLVTAFNGDISSDKEKLCLNRTGTVLKITYPEFLTPTQGMTFHNYLSKDNSTGSEAIKFGRAFAHCYGLDHIKVNKFAAIYESQILDGCGMFKAVTIARESQTDPDNKEHFFSQDDGGVLDLGESWWVKQNHAQTARNAPYNENKERVREQRFDSASARQELQPSIWYNEKESTVRISMFQNKPVSDIMTVRKEVSADGTGIVCNININL